MSWQVPGEPEGSASAFDGDADIAYALLLADAQWGSGGSIDYAREARTMIAGILESTIGPDSRLPMLGDWVRKARWRGVDAELARQEWRWASMHSCLHAQL